MSAPGSARRIGYHGRSALADMIARQTGIDIRMAQAGPTDLDNYFAS
jgi:hypothetical protein